MSDEPPQRPERPGRIETPCIDVCVVDRHGYCAGCRRSLEEIATWGTMTDEQRETVMALLPGRTLGGLRSPGGD